MKTALIVGYMLCALLTGVWFEAMEGNYRCIGHHMGPLGAALVGLAWPISLPMGIDAAARSVDGNTRWSHSACSK